MNQVDRKSSLLLVDDEPDVLLSLKALLRRQFDLYTAECGEEALAILAETSIDIVMSDQRMPGMSGSDLMIRVCELYPRTIRLIFTGFADINTVIEGVNHGRLYRYMQKPWDPEALLATLSDADQERRRISQSEAQLQQFESFVRDTVTLIEQTPDVGSAELRRSLSDRAARLLDAKSEPPAA